MSVTSITVGKQGERGLQVLPWPAVATLSPGKGMKAVLWNLLQPNLSSGKVMLENESMA